jgi:hypothetical protein
VSGIDWVTHVLGICTNAKPFKNKFNAFPFEDHSLIEDNRSDVKILPWNVTRFYTKQGIVILLVYMFGMIKFKYLPHKCFIFIDHGLIKI